jgi:hypothetical protein
MDGLRSQLGNWDGTGRKPNWLANRITSLSWLGSEKISVRHEHEKKPGRPKTAFLRQTVIVEISNEDPG